MEQECQASADAPDEPGAEPGAADADDPAVAPPEAVQPATARRTAPTAPVAASHPGRTVRGQVIRRGEVIRRGRFVRRSGGMIVILPDARPAPAACPQAGARGRGMLLRPTAAGRPRPAGTPR